MEPRLVNLLYNKLCYKKDNKSITNRKLYKRSAANPEQKEETWIGYRFVLDLL